MPNSVLATRFNNLQQRIRTVLGTSLSSNPQFGYGQTFSSTSVTGDYDTNLSNTDLISAEEYAELYEDIVRSRVHQIGSAAFAANMQALPQGDIENNPNADKIEETYISYLEGLVTDIENNKFEIDSTQYAIENLLDVNSAAINITRQESVAGSWNGTISHVFKITFPTAASRRHFFNAGGQIRTRASISWPFSQNKTNDWKNLLTNMGAVCFGATSTFRTGTLGTGTGSNIGNYDLTSSYQLVFRQTGSLYTGSFYELYALNLSDTEIQFRVYFRDTTSENIDENVFGDLTSLAEVARPDGLVSYGGSNITTVEIGTPPIGQNITVFAGVVLPTPPTVSASWGPSVTEGQSQTLTWSSTNSNSVSYVITDPDGTQLFNTTGQSTNGSKTVTWQSAGTGTAVVTAIGNGGAATTTATTSVAQQVLIKSYTITPATPSTQNEGASKTFTVSTVNVPAGTLLYWQAISTSGSLTGSDFARGVLQGSISVQSNGTATLVMTLQNDTTTDPNESYRIEIHETSQRLNAVVTSGLVTINDTSKSPITYTIQGVSSYPSDPNLISEKFYTTTFTVRAYRDGSPLTNGDGDGNFYWTTRGTNITSADFTDGTTVGRVRVTNGVGTFVRDATEDLTQEGTESFIIDLRLTSYSSSVVASSNSITISDDSQPPVPVPPTINAFQFKATSYVNGDTATLEWTTSLADSVTYTITQPNGTTIGPTTTTAVNSSVDFTLQGTNAVNATLTATNSDGTDTANAPPVLVTNPPPQPTGNISWSSGDFYQTSSLPASQVRASYPDTANVSFSGNNFTDLRVQILDANGNVASQNDYTSAGSVSFSTAISGSPGALARLYGKNADYPSWQLLDSAYKVVINEPSQVTINSFSWVPNSATVGDNVSVNWTTSNATSALLEYGSTSVNVNTNGTRTDSFSTAGTKSAVLTATNVMTVAVAQANISVSGASPLELTASFDNTFGVGDTIQATWIVGGNPSDISSGSIQLTDPNGTVVDSTNLIGSGYYFDTLQGTASVFGTYSITGSVTHNNGTVYTLVGEPVQQATAITQVTLVPRITPSSVIQNQNYTVSLTTDPVLANTSFTTTEFGTLQPSGTTWIANGRTNTFTTDSQGNWAITGVHTGDIDYYFTVDFGTTSTNQWTITNNGAASNTLQVRTPSSTINWNAASYAENDTISASWTSSNTSGTPSAVIAKSGSGIIATSSGSSGTISVPSAGVGDYSAYVTDGSTIISNVALTTVASTPVLPPPTISITPSSGAINSTSYTLTWNANGNANPSVYSTQPDGVGTTFISSDQTGTVSSVLGVVGTWTFSIATAGGSASTTTVVGAPPPTPSISITPSAGVINQDQFTVSWNSNTTGVTVDVYYINPTNNRVSVGSSQSGSLTGTLGVAGTWNWYIETSNAYGSNSASTSHTVNPPAPTTSGYINFDDNNAGYTEGDSAVATWSTSNTTTTVTAYMYRDAINLVASGNGTSGQLVFDTAGYPGSSLTAVLVHGTTALGSDTSSITAAPPPPPPPPPPPAYSAPSLSFTPSTGTINSTSFTLSWDTNGAPLTSMSIVDPNGTITPDTRTSATITSPLGIAGTWTASIVTPGGSDSASVTVTSASAPPPPPPPPAVGTPSISISPTFGEQGVDVFTLSWNANGATSGTVTYTAPTGYTGNISAVNGNGSYSSVLNVQGNWSFTITTPGGSDSTSATVFYIPSGGF